MAKNPGFAAKFSQLRVFCQGLDASLSFYSRNIPALYYQQVARYPTAKHYDPKFKKLRREKFSKYEFPDRREFQKKTIDERRKELKEAGELPPRPSDKPFNTTCTGEVFDRFVPPEGDGKASLIALQRSKDEMTNVKSKSKSYLEIRKIKKYLDFNYEDFVDTANRVYVESHNLLQDFVKNHETLHDYITDSAYMNMTHGLEYKTLRWKFIESIEPARVVHVRTTDLMSKTNLFAQVTARFHTRQTLALYDRFGKLMYGSEHQAKDVLEYIVFENHVSNLYGKWRIHDKIMPDWMPRDLPLVKTFRQPVFEDIPPPAGVDDKNKKQTEKTADSTS